MIMNRSSKFGRKIKNQGIILTIKTSIKIKSITLWIILIPVLLFPVLVNTKSAELSQESLPFGPGQYLCNLLNLVQMVLPPCLSVFSILLQKIIAFIVVASPLSEPEKPKTATPRCGTGFFIIVIHIFSFFILL